MSLYSGRQERLPYSLSRWTDLSAAKWDWFKSQLGQGKMRAFDPRNAVPVEWSLDPLHTLGLIFWTKNPENLIRDKALLDPYKLVIHMTLTGWEEVEKGAPNLDEGISLMRRTVETFGPERVTWRFSPVPLVDDVLDRFERMASVISVIGLKEVYVAFLQENDLMPEARPQRARFELLKQMAARSHGLNVRLCNEDNSLRVGGAEWKGTDAWLPNLSYGICESGLRFADKDRSFTVVQAEGCGCSLAVDPFTINETCTMGCAYCLDPQTPVLYADDLVWRPIGEAQIGDRLLGFDEYPDRPGAQRKLRETTIEGVQWSRQQTLRMVTGETEVVTTGNHGWITHRRGQWRSTGQLRVGSDLRQIGYTPNLPFTDDFRRGYLAGMTLGDGTMRFQPGWRSDKKGFPQAYWRVALKDDEALGRLVAYLASFGVEAHIQPFSSGSSTRAPMQKVEVRSLGRLGRIHDLLHGGQDSLEYRRGFLSGFFDAEGSHADNLRFYQKDRTVLDRVEEYASSLGFSFKQEFYGTGCPATHLVGPARERIRFLGTIRPAISRKVGGLFGVEADSTSDFVRSIEKGPVQDVVDIQTSTHTFFAAGLATHNCYAADKTLAPRKHNTTRSLPLIVS